MARQSRHTEPLETALGTLTDYAEIDRHLLDGEFKGLVWVLDRAKASTHLSTPTDGDIRELHRVMYGGFLLWAGELRKEDVGPSGRVPVRWSDVPVELWKFAGDLRAWVDALPSEPSLEGIAGVVADAHHRFQWIHPFRDTNGRTGRVLDAYLLWVTFGLAGSDVQSSVFIEPFPTPAAEDEYYLGLQEADNYAPDRLRRYYVERIETAFLAHVSVTTIDGAP
jgi:fido (protein-threonine AMPylation protein)